MRRPRRKALVERVAEEGYWEGFFGCLGNGSSFASLEYTSTSRLYDFNECRRIAYAAGYAYCEEVLAERERRREGKTAITFFDVNRKVPGRVMADCYGAARVAA